MKKNFLIVIVTLLIVLVAATIFIRFLPSKTLVSVFGNEGLGAKIFCSYPVHVNGDSMGEFFKSGDTAFFTKCFLGSDIKEGSLILFKDKDINRLGEVDQIYNDGEKFRVTQTNNKIFTVLFENILAIYKN